MDLPVGNGNVFCTKGGQLDPPVGNGNIFCTKGGQLDPTVSDVTFFAPKEVSLKIFLMIKLLLCIPIDHCKNEKFQR